VNTATHEQVAGVVVLYNPVIGVLDNIRSYLPQIGRLYAIDNSETADPEIVRQLAAMPAVMYRSNGGNRGVASALNSGAERALTDGYRYLLTMDQDSRAVSGMVSVLLECLSKLDSTQVGIISPDHVTKPGTRSVAGEDCRKVQYVMTSGNLLNLQAYQTVGAFNEDLFIDFVDVEYCLRLNAHGFSVFQAMNAHLEHQVGDLVGIKLGPFPLYITSHSPLRMYYKTRNRFYVTNLYRRKCPAFWWQDRLRFFLEMCRLLLFEPQKKHKITMMWRGWRDCRERRLGKYDERLS
jgi:rhamnosyltransferase